MTQSDRESFEVEQLLRSVFQDDAPPARARELMLDALQFVEAAPTADLVLDTADMELAVRGHGPRQVLYETPSVAFDVVLNTDGVSGQISGEGATAHHEVRMVTTTDDHTAELDSLGEFGFGVSPREPFYLQVGDAVRTGWILQ